MNKKELLEDKELILFIEALTYCQTNNKEYIKYATLRGLCNEKLVQLTSGERTELGGSFESMIKRLSDPSAAADKRFFTRTRSEYTRKDSRIYPNIDLIKSELQKRKLISYLDSDRKVISYSTVSKRLSENAKISETLRMKVTRVKSRDFLKKDAGPGLSSSLESNLVDVFAPTAGYKDTLDIKNTITQFQELVKDIAIQNKTQRSFIVLLRYNGIPNSLNELIKSERFSDFYQKLSAYFVEWAECFEKYEVTQQDKIFLLEGKIEALSEVGKNKVTVFLENLIDNIPKDNASIPIVSEIYQKISSNDGD
ncbi:hypothetical protein BH18THE2_BH18THE2_14360 [soil metagenome]